MSLTRALERHSQGLSNGRLITLAPVRNETCVVEVAVTSAGEAQAR